MNEIEAQLIENETLIFNCPWCENLVLVLIKDLNCKIFRHAMNHSFKQIKR